ncbi:MAG: AbrB/MazE/SpoVT family DNA-binding domain-containing protein [Planctomycetaceae bacterium]
MPVWKTKVDKSGRVPLPVERRDAMQAAPGSELAWIRTDEGIRLEHLDDLIVRIQGDFESLSRLMVSGRTN